MKTTNLFLIALLFVSTACVEPQFAELEAQENSISPDELVSLNGNKEDFTTGAGNQEESTNSGNNVKKSTVDGSEEIANIEEKVAEVLSNNVEQPLIEEIVKNIACLDLLSDNSDAFDAEGESYTANGDNGIVNVFNVDLLTVSGNTQSLIADGANEVQASGNIRNVCIRANFVSNLSGNLGSEPEFITILGESLDGERAFAEHINGNANSEIVLVDVDVDRVNGNFKEIHIYGGTVNLINGNGAAIYLYNGAEVLEVNGNIELVENR